MLKVGAFLAHHQPVDAWNTGQLLAKVVQRGRDFINGFAGKGSNLESVAKAGGKCAQQVATKSVLQPLCVQKPNLWKNVVTSYLRRNDSPATLLSKFAKRCNSEPLFGSWRSRGDHFAGIGRKIALFGFVGIAMSPKDRMSWSDFSYGGQSGVHVEIRNMFATEEKQPTCTDSTKLSTVTTDVDLDQFELGDIITHDNSSVVFSAKLVAEDVKEKSHIEESICASAEEEIIADVKCPDQQLQNAELETENAETAMAECLESVEFNEQQCANLLEMIWQQHIKLSNLVQSEPAVNVTSIIDSSSLDFSWVWHDDSICMSTLNEGIGYVDQQSATLTNLLNLSYLHNRQLQALMQDGKTSEYYQEVPESKAESAEPDDNKYDLTIKVQLVNNGSSQSQMVKRLLNKHLLPAELIGSSVPSINGKMKHHKLPTHFNVIRMYSGFMTPVSNVNAVLNVASANHFWPMQIPRADMALCMVMKRYKFTLADFLSSHSIDIKSRCLLLLQLLEAILHLDNHNISHRNLSSNNIFVEFLDEQPHLVVAGFGNCLQTGGGFFRLKIPFVTEETYKGGPLLPPEIVTAETYSILNYTKSDIWSAGCIAYEIFGAVNPFCSAIDIDKLSPDIYKNEDLADLPDSVPRHLNKLIKLMLRREPHERPSVETVANTLHLLMWTPNEWMNQLESGAYGPSLSDVRCWLVQFAAFRFCYEQILKPAPCSIVTNHLQKKFLSRTNPHKINAAVHLLRSCYSV